MLSDDPSISADGRYIAFAFGDANSVPADAQPSVDIFVRDTCAGVLSGCTPLSTRVSAPLVGSQKYANYLPTELMISADGHFVVFRSSAKLAPGGSDSGGYIYLARH
jgi:Tol biopolymer transport system component